MSEYIEHHADGFYWDLNFWLCTTCNLDHYGGHIVRIWLLKNTII